MGYTNLKQVLDRADITDVTQGLVAGEWVWQGKTAAAWATDIAAAKAKRLEVRTKKRALTTARTAADEALDKLHNLTAQGLGMARSKYRREPGSLADLSLLEAGGHGRHAILEEAAEWKVAWSHLPDTDWEPTPTNTQALFDAAYQDAETKLKALREATQDERKSRRECHEILADLWQDCVEWLIDAELVFAEGTPNGDVVRAVVTHVGTNEPDDETEGATGGAGAGTGDDGLPEK